MSAALLAKAAAENKQLRDQVAELQAKLAAADKRAAAEAELLAVSRDPRAPLDLRPVDIDDFLAKRAELEALPDLGAMRTAVKIAATGSYSVGESDPEQSGAGAFRSPSGSKAEENFVNAFLGDSAGG